jgi:pilus assembly protein CpaB
MNTQRIVMLGLALVAACGAAFVVRGMMGGGTPQVAAKPAPQIAMSEVMVASEVLQPGEALDAGKVHWQNWPTKDVDQSFITHEAVSSLEDAVKDTVVRAPILANQPVTSSAIVHGQAAGFMAAMLNSGMRAVAINISTDSGVGGFILPNDRVDLILTQKSNDSPPRVRAITVLASVRVLAIDQTPKMEKDQKSILGKTATLELTPAQAELVAKAQSMGQLSLSLRPLGDDTADAPSANGAAPKAPHVASLSDDFSGHAGNSAVRSNVTVIRYGIIAKGPTSSSSASPDADNGSQRGIPQ